MPQSACFDRPWLNISAVTRSKGLSMASMGSDKRFALGVGYAQNVLSTESAQ
ncbi:MAG: hypothetical protein KC475_09475 [Cyanobacteria bacterium HKST-UBA03]|nr:hypothetical protein [Cyanobacteria bacterium HKST-UBA03]